MDKLPIEKARHNEGDRAREYLDIAGVMLIALNPDGEITLINKRGAEILGIAADDIIGKSWFQTFLREADREAVMTVHARIVSGDLQPVEYYENNIVTANGEIRLVAWHNAMLRDETGCITGTLSSGEDITKRRQAEQALTRRLAMEELVTSISTRFVTVTPDDFAEQIDTTLKDLGEFFDVDRCHLIFTEPACDFIDHMYEWCAGGVTARADQVKGLSLEPFHWIMERLLQMETVHVPHMIDLPPEAHIEKAYWQRNGVLSVLSIPIAHNKSLAGILGFSMTRAEMTWSEEDLRLMKLVGEMITNVLTRFEARQTLTAYARQLEAMVQARTQALQDAQEQLLRREKLAFLGQLAGSIGHELRNPLGSMKNAVYILRMLSNNEHPDCLNSLDIIDQEIETANAIISSLLDYARTKKPITGEVKINQVLKDVFARTPVSSCIETECVLDPADPSIVGDYGQVMQIFNNLVLNAVEAMPEAGRLTLRTLEVTDLETPHHQWVEVAIADTGKGIPAENLSKIFEPLFSTKAKGIGLGLTLVKTLVEGHGGSLRVNSIVGQGSVFTVRLPAWPGSGMVFPDNIAEGE